MNTEKRHLRYDFTASEIHDMSVQLANKTKEHGSITEEKKSVNSQYTARLNDVKATCNRLSNLVSDGFEFREYECTIEYNKPSHGKKTIIRKDTDAIVAVETMSEFDWNLFNQPAEESAF